MLHHDSKTKQYFFSFHRFMMMKITISSDKNHFLITVVVKTNFQWNSNEFQLFLGKKTHKTRVNSESRQVKDTKNRFINNQLNYRLN